MNYNQQIQGKPHSLQEQGYNCDNCLRLIPVNQEKRHYLDDNRVIKMGCVLCPAM